jgi:hypothetical protein
MGDIDLKRVMGGNPWRQNGHQNIQQNYRKPNHAQAVG